MRKQEKNTKIRKLFLERKSKYQKNKTNKEYEEF